MHVLTFGEQRRDNLLLNELATSSHGAVFETKHDKKLRDTFAGIGRVRSLSTYRLTVLEKAELRWPIEIFAGRQPHVLALRVNDSTASTEGN